MAFGTFRRYVYNPFESGGLGSNGALANAGKAAAASVQEVVQAKQEAKGGTAVRELFAPLAALAATLDQLATKLTQGHADAADIKSASGAIANIEKSAAAAGIRITEQAPHSAP